MGHWHFIDHLLQFLFSNSRITEIVLDPIILVQPEVDNKEALDWRIRSAQASRERSHLRAAQKRERESERKFISASSHPVRGVRRSPLSEDNMLLRLRGGPIYADLWWPFYLLYINYCYMDYNSRTIKRRLKSPVSVAYLINAAASSKEGGSEERESKSDDTNQFFCTEQSRVTGNCS